MIRDLLLQLIPDAHIIIEAGGHKGRDAVKLAKKFPQATVFSCEPVPALFEELKKAASHVANIRVFNTALSNRTGNTDFHISSGRSDACSSIHKPTEKLLESGVCFTEKIMVTTLTLDDFAAREKIEQCDILWLDAQGHELSVLQGGEKILQTLRACYIEVNLIARYHGAPSEKEITEWFRLRNFEELYRDAPRHEKVNILFVKK